MSPQAPTPATWVARFEEDKLGSQPVEPLEIQTTGQPVEEIYQAIYATAVMVLSGRGVDIEFLLHQDAGTGQGTVFSGLTIAALFTLTKKES